MKTFIQMNETYIKKNFQALLLTALYLQTISGKLLL